MKAKLGMRKVRPWKWMPFTNPARRDNLVLHHWRRQADEGKEYAFARFNKKLEMPTFSDIEYQNHLTAEGNFVCNVKILVGLTYIINEITPLCSLIQLIFSIQRMD